jgi:hypothetical protein
MDDRLPSASGLALICGQHNPRRDAEDDGTCERLTGTVVAGSEAQAAIACPDSRRYRQLVEPLQSALDSGAIGDVSRVWTVAGIGHEATSVP